jgi:O-antigen/teichoic acid export membrane protein
MIRERRRHAALATLTGTGLTVCITVAQAFLLVPLCLSHLGAALYGAWRGAFELLVWVQLLDCGIPNLLTQRVAAALARGDQADAARWTSTAMTTLVVIACLLAFAGALIAPFVGRWVDVPHDQAATFMRCFQVGVLASAVLLVFNGLLGLSRGVQLTALVNVSQVAGGLAGLLVSIVLLIKGWGLWALPIGLLVRALSSLAGGIVFLWRLPRDRGGRIVRPARALAGEIMSLAPSMASGSVGYLLANNSEIFLVATIFGPVTATMYALTRSAIDGLRNLLDSFAWAVYGGFSHLVTAVDRHRARAVLHEVLWLRFAAGCLCGAIAIAVNRAFVTLLFGADHFGGVWLTVGFALQMVVGGQAFLANFLYRAAGHVGEGSLWLAAEAVARVAAMLAGFFLIGILGAPWAAVVVSTAALLVMTRLLNRTLPPSDVRAAAGHWTNQVAPLVVLAFGVAVALTGPSHSWIGIVATGTVVALLGGGLLWVMVPASSGIGALPRWLSSPMGR